MIGAETFGGLIAAALKATDETALRVCAFELANQVASAGNLCPERTFDALTYVPQNMLGLLSSPDGWAALAQLVAADLGVERLDFRPTVH